MLCKLQVDQKDRVAYTPAKTLRDSPRATGQGKGRAQERGQAMARVQGMDGALGQGLAQHQLN